MKRFLLVLMAGVMVAMTCRAKSAAYRSLELNGKDGSSMLVNMAKDMEVRCEGDSLVVASEECMVKLALKSLRGWNFVAHEPASDSAPGVSAPFTMEGNTIVPGNLPAGTTLILTDMGGRTVGVYPATAPIRLDGLRSGIYLLTVNGRTVKIAVK